MTEAKDPRDEAERLIASVLGGASVAAENLDGWATGSAECCVCPVCRAIAATRQPNANIAERLASGAGDLAQGLASVLRAFSGGFPGSSSQSTPPAASGSTSTATDEDPWHIATRADAEAEATGSAPAAAAGAAPGAAEPAAPPNPPKPMAKKATKPKAAPEPPKAAPQPEPEPPKAAPEPPKAAPQPEPEPGEES
jgi:hypothetical protein